MRKFNLPIKGHTLIYEGHMHGDTQGPWDSPRVTAVGGCSCGYQPLDWQTMSVNKVKRWHREHKEAIRAGKPAPAVGLSFTTEGWSDLLHEVQQRHIRKPGSALG